ncbi:MAG: hypothetical protein EHM33_18690 [Chloroflexi bacterium]|nr:MAG: hypothetical protein EHM33_18690 [Chloroflexota bacterium]
MSLLATALLDLFAMAITLWMAFYLFARGFPNRVTMRAVIVLLALSVFFYGAYNNIFYQIPGTAAWRAVLLVIGLASWYSLTYQVMSIHNQKRFRWLEISMYILAFLTAVLLLSPDSFIGEVGNALFVAHMRVGFPFILYSLYQWGVALCILLNLLIDDKVGLTTRGKYFLVASMFPAASVIYGVTGLIAVRPLLRIVPDMLIFCGVFLLSLSVARHQTLLERRTTLQDFPITTLTILGLSAVYAYIGWRLGLPVEMMAAVVGLAILTHSFYDLVREFLERVRIRREGAFRKQLRQLESAGENALRDRLQEGLDLLCQTLNAPSGLIAIRGEDEFLVTATRHSVPLESRISADQAAFEDISQPGDGQLRQLAWIAPSFDGQTQIAFIGIGKPKTRLNYSASDLELLTEVADQIGTIVSLNNLRPRQTDQIRQLVAESRANVTELNSIAGEMIDAITTHPDSEFIKMVEEALRHWHDTIDLGQSPLAEWAKVDGGSHVERGRQLQQLLNDAIESLRPAEKRPGEPLPRVWYNYAVLHDAYVEGAQNREIMARLYISEGTFNRTRRNAIRGLARLLVEKIRR